MRKFSLMIVSFLLVLLPATSNAFLEDLCQARTLSRTKPLSWCIRPTCPGPNKSPNRVCPEQTADFITIKPGRSMIHADSTYFIAQALGYRADVAYWIAAYNEVTDYGVYKPIDQCGVQASSSNSGANFISAAFDGFVRTNRNTDGPLDHYIVNFSPNGKGTDVHGAGGVSALYPFHYPQPGYPVHIDDTYQKTLANLRQWGMLPGTDPGLLCTVGLTDGDKCLTGSTITGVVPFFVKISKLGAKLSVPTGPKVLDDTNGIVYYDHLKSWLDDPARTTGTLYKAAVPQPVPLQVARFGLYLHILQDSSSHATYCGDDAPTPPGGGDPGTYMYQNGTTIQLSFGNSCANSPHLAGHVQETGTGDNPLPLRVYVALNNTVDELIAFGNEVALHQPGWIVNPELLPPNVTGGKNGQGNGAEEIKALLVGTIQSGTAYSNAEVYKSGIVSLPLQQTDSLDRLHAMNLALSNYSDTLRKQTPTLVPFEPMPGNSADANNTSVCWK